MSGESFDEFEAEATQPRVSETPVLTSCGLILFNQEGHVLVLRRSSSYAFSSIFSMLLLKETTATRPDEFIRICQELVSECTPGELELLKRHWTPEGFQELLDQYLRKLPAETLIMKLRNEFQSCSLQVKCLWGLLLSSVNIAEVSPGDNYRIHDVPKGRDCQSFAQIRQQVRYETGLNLPQELTLGNWHEVSYVCNTGIVYKFKLRSAKCEGMVVNKSNAQWRCIDQIKAHSSIKGVMKKSLKDF